MLDLPCHGDIPLLARATGRLGHLQRGRGSSLPYGLVAGSSLVGQVEPGAFRRPGVEVAAGGGDRGVAEGGLHQVDGGVAVEGVAGVGVAHPVGRDVLFEAGAAGGGVDEAAHLGDVERSPAVAAAEDGVGGLGLAADGERAGPRPWASRAPRGFCRPCRRR